MMSTDGRVELLDHGFLSLVETWGSEARIIESARMSTGKGFLGWGPRCKDCGHTFDEKIRACDRNGCTCRESRQGDERLLRHLYTNMHMTPFEMAGATFEIQAPIFVFREWHRHRTQSYNEMSARYTPLPDVNYIPSIARLTARKDDSNKQAAAVAGVAALTEFQAGLFRAHLDDFYRSAEALYRNALAAGVPKELARLPVPVGRYSRMRASANLRNWLQFLTLRDEEHAQWEIRQYAAAVRQVLSTTFPRTLALFDEGRR